MVPKKGLKFVIPCSLSLLGGPRFPIHRFHNKNFRLLQSRCSRSLPFLILLVFALRGLRAITDFFFNVTMNRLLVYGAVIGGGLLSTVRAVDVLSTSGFQTCGNGTQDITVSQFKLSFDRSNNELMFAVAGNSLVSQNVVGSMQLML